MKFKIRIKNLFVLATLLMAFTGESIAQTNPILIPYRKGKLWGYCDTLGVLKIKPIYSRVNFFWNDFGRVQFNKKEGAINHQGRIVLPYKYDDVFYGKYNAVTETYIFIVLLNNKFGLISSDGKWLIAKKYDKLEPINFEATKFQGSIGDKKYVCFLNERGIWQSKLIYQFPERQEENKIVVESDTSDFKIDRFWKTNADSFKIYYQEEILVKYFKNSKCGIGNYTKMQFITAAKYNTITALSENYFSYVNDENKCGVVELKNTEKIVVPFIYHEVIKIDDNYVITKKNKLCGIAFIKQQLNPIKNTYSQIGFLTTIPVTVNNSFIIFKVAKYKFL